MRPPRVVEVDCYEFLDNLRKAAAAGKRIEKSDKQQWEKYIKEHKVHEASCISIGRSRAESVKAVIIDDDGPWSGYYVYSVDDQVCLKYIPAED